MSSLSSDTAQRVLRAALKLFARHGFQRTSMADIAVEAGVARATLYLRYSDKRALFVGLADALVTDALRDAAAAWTPGEMLARNLELTILAKDLPLWRLLHAPHGAELLALDADLTRRHAERLDKGFAELLAQRAAAEPGLDLAILEGADEFGIFLASAAAGLKHETRSETAYLTGVRQLCAVVAKAVTPAVSRQKDPRDQGRS